MGLSETITAAAIGALATVTAAVFQLITALRARNKVDARPKRGSALRSVLAIMALMVASAGSGFLFSEFLKQRSGEDMRAMRQELRELTALIADGKDRARSSADAAASSFDAAVLPVSAPAARAAQAPVESIAYVPACRRTDLAVACGEADAQRIALCGTVPAYARVIGIDLFAQPDAVQRPWDVHRAAFEQDLGGARFTGKSFEYAQSDDLKAVCVNFMQWSSEHPYIARILVRYGFGDSAPAPQAIPAATPLETETVAPPAVIAADGLTSMPNAAALTTPARTQ